METSRNVTYAALADPTRLNIIDMLAHQGELTASKICAAFSSTPSAVSQHLKVLRRASLVHMQKRGQQRVYSLDVDQLNEAGQWLQKRTALWNARLDSLEAYVAKQNKKQENL